MVIWSSPAWPRRSSSLPKALTENGQVGSRNTSKTRGPWPQTSGSVRHVFFIRSFLLRLVDGRPQHGRQQQCAREKTEYGVVRDRPRPCEVPESSRSCRISFLRAAMIISGAPSDLGLFSAAQAAPIVTESPTEIR